MNRRFELESDIERLQTWRDQMEGLCSTTRVQTQPLWESLTRLIVSMCNESDALALQGFSKEPTNVQP